MMIELMALLEEYIPKLQIESNRELYRKGFKEGGGKYLEQKG